MSHTPPLVLIVAAILVAALNAYVLFGGAIYVVQREFHDLKVADIQAALADLPPLAGFVPDAEVVEILEQTLRVTPVVDPPAPGMSTSDAQPPA